jgi:hypothetical protein
MPAYKKSLCKSTLLAMLFCSSIFSFAQATTEAFGDGSINVKLFGAKGDGISDDTQAIKSAVSRAAVTHSRVIFPPGTYLVSSSIRTNPSLAIKAPTTDVELAGAAESSWMYDSGTMSSTIKATGAWAPDTAMLDLRDTTRLSVRGLGIDCSGKAPRGIEIGDENGPTGPSTTNIFIGGNSIHNCGKNLVGYNTGILRVVKNNISGASITGMWFQYMGDSDFEGNFVNTNAPGHVEAGDYDPAGGFYCVWCGNFTIHGGKFEWNARGIALLASFGVSVYGIIFDVNKTQSIEIFNDQSTSKGNVYQPRGIDIYGNRFIAGGSRSQASGIGRRDFIMIGTTAANADERITIVGNTFRKGGDLAYDLNDGPNVGPLDDAIGISGNAINVTISGNDMRDSSVTNCVWEAHDPVVHWYGNDCNLPIVSLDSSTAMMDSPVPIISTVPTGKPPIIFQSSTPMPGGVLANHPEVFVAGVQSTAVKIYTNTVKLTNGIAYHTFDHSFSFSNVAYTCQATGIGAAPGALSVQITSPDAVIIHGSGSQMVAISCVGD